MQTIAGVVPSLRPKASHGLRVVAIGDSLVYGYGDPIGGGWVERLRRQWMQPSNPGHAIYNLGVRGNRARQVVDRLEQEYRLRGELQNRLPDLILLSVGVNDSPRLGRPDGRNLTDYGDFYDDMATLLDEAGKLCPILFIGMVPVDESQMPFMDCLYYNHQDQRRYKDVTRHLCQERQIPYLDVFESWMQQSQEWRRSRLTEDGLHPNSLGYQVLLQAVCEWQPCVDLLFDGQPPSQQFLAS